MLAPQILRRRKLLANNVGGGLVPSLNIGFSAFQNAPNIFTYTRATTATVTDFEGLIKSCLSGELRVQGARRVANAPVSGGSSSQPGSLNSATKDSDIDDPLGGTLAGRFTITNGGGFQLYNNHTPVNNGNNTIVTSIYLRGVGASVGKTVLLWIFDGASTNATVTLTAGWKRYSLGKTGATLTPTRVGLLGGGTLATNDKVDVFGTQYEQTTGQSNQNPSEYVSVGVESTPHHGYFVDGVKYFSYENGNTVTDNVVTEAQGTPITGTIGYLAEGARTDSALYNRDLTQADWSKTDCTAAKDAVGQDGTANGCSTLTATGANATCLQTVTAASAAKVFQPSVKRKTGTGTVEITVNGGTNWQDITAELDTVEWYEAAEARTVTNPQFGFRITTSGDEIIVDYAGCQNGTFRSSSIPTTTAAVARNADVLTFPVAGIVPPQQHPFTVFVKFTQPSLEASAGGVRTYYAQTSTSFRALYVADVAGGTNGKPYAYNDAAATGPAYAASAITAGASAKMAAVFDGTNLTMYKDGTAGTPVAMGAGGTLNSTGYIGVQQNGIAQAFGVIDQFKVFRSALSTSQVAAL